MKVREAKIEDVDAVAQLFDGYRVFYRKESDVDGAKAFLSERINNKESRIYVCEESDGTFVGFTQLYPLFTSTRMKRAWLLNDLYVHPDHRGKGASKMLIQRGKELVRETGAFGMMLETEKSNDIGNKLYPSVGFKLNDDSNFYEWTA